MTSQADRYPIPQPQFSIIAYEFGMAAAKRREGYKNFGSAFANAMRELIGTYAFLSEGQRQQIDIKVTGTPNWKPATLKISITEDDGEKSLEAALVNFLEELGLSIENNTQDPYMLPEIYSHSQQHFITFQTPWAAIQMLKDFIYVHADFMSLDSLETELSERGLNDRSQNDEAFKLLSDREFEALPPVILTAPHLANKYAEALKKAEKRSTVNTSILYLESLLNQVTGYLNPDHPQFQIH